MNFGIPELDEQLNKLIESASKVEEIQEKLSNVSGYGEAADGRVRVYADNAGRVSDVQIDSRAMKLADDLAESVTEAAQ